MPCHLAVFGLLEYAAGTLLLSGSCETEYKCVPHMMTKEELGVLLGFRE